METVIENFCTCKKGIQSVDLVKGNKTAGQLLIDCDKDKIVQSSTPIHKENKVFVIDEKKLKENEFKIDSQVSKMNDRLNRAQLMSSFPPTMILTFTVILSILLVS